VARSVAFYTQQLGLTLDQQPLPAFAQVSVGDLKLILIGRRVGLATYAERGEAGPR
jgi:hypothetical protein